MATPVVWFKKFLFEVQIDGITRAAFQKASGLSAEVSTIDYYEGGRMHPYSMPGRVTFEEFTLSRGQCIDKELYMWFKEVYDSKAASGAYEQQIYRNLEFVQYDRDHSELQRIAAYDCWPRKYETGDWDAEADELRIETVTIKADRWEIK